MIKSQKPYSSEVFLNSLDYMSGPLRILLIASKVSDQSKSIYNIIETVWL
jgi:hypothetical protein